MPRPEPRPDVDVADTSPIHDEDVFYALCPCGLEFLAEGAQVELTRLAAHTHSQSCEKAQKFKAGGLVNVRNQA